MNQKKLGDTRATLTEETYRRCINATLMFLKTKKSIRNQDLRKLTGIQYDLAISFFNRAIFENVLRRNGSKSGTYYTLSSAKAK